MDKALEHVVIELRRKGHSQRQVSTLLKISRNTVKKIEKSATQADPDIGKNACGPAILELIRTLYTRCNGNLVRVQEILVQEYEKPVPYSTLTYWVRKYQIRGAPKRAGCYEFEPGQEMQHDTSPHWVMLGGKRVKAQCASLTLAYSRKIYVQYYPRFTRFEAQQFLKEALEFMGGSCRRCIIDNTSVVLKAGCGNRAVFCTQMETFGRFFGFEFLAHALFHADRKARVERPFHYIENNFLAGRDFREWDDLNQQAKKWCIEVANTKTKRELGLSPDAAFIQEAPYLIALPKVMPPIYEHHRRQVDSSGYINLKTHRYSVPEKYIGKMVDVYQYIQSINIYYQEREIATHSRQIAGKHKRFLIPGHHQALYAKQKNALSIEPEKQLMGKNAQLDAYLTDLKKHVRGRGFAKFSRLLELKRTYPEGAFFAAIEQALKYGLFDLGRLETLIIKCVGGDYFHWSLENSDE